MKRTYENESRTRVILTMPPCNDSTKRNMNPFSDCLGHAMLLVYVLESFFPRSTYYSLVEKSDDEIREKGITTFFEYFTEIESVVDVRIVEES